VFSSNKNKPKNVDAKKVRGYIYRDLAKREWARKMLVQKIIGKCGKEHMDLIEEVMQEFVDEDLQSDERFSECYIRDCRDNRGYGPIKTKMKLMEKGVSASVFETYLASCHEIWQVRCAQVQMRKYGQAPSDRNEYASQMRFLTQRGFTNEHIKKACYDNKSWNERPEILTPEEEVDNSIDLEYVKAIINQG
jgi:regulatory protein